MRVKRVNIESLKKELNRKLERYLSLQLLRGLMLITLEFKTKKTIDTILLELMGIVKGLNVLEFDFLYKKSNNNYVYLMGIKSIFGNNEKLLNILEVLGNSINETNSVVVQQIKNKFNLKKVKINDLNENTLMYFSFYSNNEFADNLLDVLTILYIEYPNIKYFMKKEESFVDEIILSRSSKGITFLYNFFMLNALRVKGGKVISLVSGKTKYESLNELFSDWENIFFFMKDKFSLETLVLDSISLKEEILNKKVLELLPSFNKNSS